jgi:hypothetical protein
MPNNIDEFKNHCLPLARIKKIMKSDEDVRVNSDLGLDDFVRNSGSFCKSMLDIYC